VQLICLDNKNEKEGLGYPSIPVGNRFCQGAFCFIYNIILYFKGQAGMPAPQDVLYF
jgi:hypothetical protein